MKTVMSVMLLISTLLTATTQAYANEKFLIGEPSRQMLLSKYSVNFQKTDSTDEVWCYREVWKDILKGKHPICGVNDRRSIPAMSISIFVGESSTSDEKRKKRALRQVLVSRDYKLESLGAEDVLSSVTVTHYRVSWSYSDYKPFVSVAKFSVGENTIFAVFFNGGAKETGNTPTSIKKEVEKYLTDKRLGPVK